MNWSRITWIALTGLTLPTVGCNKTEVVVYQEVNWQGTVDESLPKEVQAKQDALIRLFTAIQDYSFEFLTQGEPNLQFDESFEQFFGETVDLFRWDWDGPPEGNDLSVVLILRKDEPGLPEVEVRRTYTVRQSGKTFRITRGQ